jgi:hypothetical protein
MTMEGQQWLFLLDKSPDRSAPCSVPCADEIQIRPIRGGVHHVDSFIGGRGLGQMVEILLNRSPLSQIDVRVNGHKLIRILSRSDVGRIFLRGPWGVEIIHFFIIFRSKGGWRDKRISDQGVIIFQQEALPIKVDHPFYRLPEKIRVTRVPVPGDEENLANPRCLDHALKEWQEETVDEALLVGNHVLISLGGSKRRKEVTA